jgi:hypothetical protein
LSQPAWLSHSPVTWDYPWSTDDFLSSTACVPALSMNCVEITTVMFLAYEILSTRLFTFRQFYSQAPTQEKLNADNALRVFADPARPAHRTVGTAFVDNFPIELGQKRA